ncbi:unnamed protein product, partial [Symbiodinium sp. CCMP2456]
DELAALIIHLMEASGTSALGDQILARASRTQPNLLYQLPAADKRAWELIAELVNIHQSQTEEAPERTARGARANSSPGKWLPALFMEGKQHTLCMRYQQGQCKDPSTCRYLHCAVPKPDGSACGGKHPASQHVSTPH